jgi:hypothetical protein
VVDEAPICFLAESVQLLQSAEVDRLITGIAALPEPPVLVIIDTLARCLVGGDENSAKDVGLANSAVDRIRRATGGAVLLVHHTRKNDNTERGSGSLRGAADAMIAVGKKGDVVTLSCDKMKDGTQFDDIRLRLVELEDSCILRPVDAVPDRSFAPEAKHIACLQELAGKPLPFTKWHLASGLAKSSFVRAKKDLTENGYVQQVGDRYELTPKGLSAL